MQQNFKYLYWFCVFAFIVGMIMLAALIWLPVPAENRQEASIAIGFITGTVISTAISFALTGSLPGPKKDDAKKPEQINGDQLQNQQA